MPSSCCFFLQNPNHGSSCSLPSPLLCPCHSVLQNCRRKGSQPKVPSPLPSFCLSFRSRRWKLHVWRNNCQQEVHHHSCPLHGLPRVNNHRCEGGHWGAQHLRRGHQRERQVDFCQARGQPPQLWQKRQ